MLTKAFIFNPVGENTYLIWDEETLEAAIIDAGMSNNRENTIVSEFITKEKLKLKYALQTHMHFDHVWGLSYITETYGLKPLCHIADESIYSQVPEMTSMFRLSMNWNLPVIERYIDEGETFMLGNTSIRVLHTPGHTPGGLSYYVESAHTIFTGDTLFQGSIGRTDLPGGDMNTEISSIKNKIITLPSDTIIYSGHGPKSNVGWELRNNPYLLY
ncbi:MAG: MBL fold metallo-hydrolase [Bacteroidaceae bacterium]|nr:MBL fold metallo-hydrolase [Bacteroidaceae bacterium]